MMMALDPGDPFLVIMMALMCALPVSFEFGNGFDVKNVGGVVGDRDVSGGKECH